MSDFISDLRLFAWDDMPAIAHLYRACEREDGSGEATSDEVLRTTLSVPGRSPESNMAVVIREGELIATASAWPTAGVISDVIQLGVRIHPAHRSVDRFAELLRWAEIGGVEAYRPTGRAVEYHAGAHANPPEWHAALSGAGFQPVRWFLTVGRSLKGELPQANVPDGATFVALADGVEPLALKRALDEAFLDHWNPPEFTDEQFLHWANSPLFRPELSLAAVTEDGSVVGGLIGRDGVAVADPMEGPEGRIEVLGVRPGWRGRGLARALLCASFAALRGKGVQQVELEVDSENPTGAMGLYASVGFEERRRVTVYGKPVVVHR